MLEALRQLRKSKGVTMKDVGAAIGVSEATVSLYERGLRSPSYEVLLKLGEYFEVSVDYLLNGSDSAKGVQNMLRSGIITPTDIAEEMGIPTDIVWDAIQTPEKVPQEMVDKIARVGMALSNINSSDSSLTARENLSKISYSFYKLNPAGQKKVSDYAEDLTKIPEYQAEQTRCTRQAQSAPSTKLYIAARDGSRHEVEVDGDLELPEEDSEISF